MKNLFFRKTTLITCLVIISLMSSVFVPSQQIFAHEDPAQSAETKSSEENQVYETTSSFTMEDQTTTTEVESIETTETVPLFQEEPTPPADLFQNFSIFSGQTRASIYSRLDEPGDLVGFNMYPDNTPVKVWSDNIRDYYAFLGGVKAADTTDSFLNGISHTKYSSVGRSITDKYLSLLNPAIVALPKNSDRLIGYSYNYSGGAYGGNTGFDFAELDYRNDVQYTAISRAAGDDYSATFGNSTIDFLYVNHETKSILVYGTQKMTNWDLNNKTQPEYYVRTKISLLPNNRVRMQLRIYNPFPVDKVIASSFGAHVDIDGLHEDSNMYTMGNNNGMYLDTMRASDGHPYLMFFHSSGFTGKANPPINIDFTNDGQFNIARGIIKYNNPNRRLPIAMQPDSPEYGTLRHREHPGFVFQYAPLTIPSYEYRDFDMEASIQGLETPKTTPIIVSYVTEAGKSISAQKTYSVPVGQSYSETALTLSGYDLISAKTLSGKVTNSNPISLRFIYRAKAVSEKTAPIIMMYQDQDGATLAPSKTDNAPVGQPYAATAIKIDGYELIGNEVRPIPVNDTSPQIVIFNYKKKTAQSQTVTVNYLDEKQQPIVGFPEKKYQLAVGETYSETAPSIPGYMLSKTDGATSGKIVANTDVKIVFTYRENMFKLIQTVEKLASGSNAAEVSTGEELLYTLKVQSQLSNQTGVMYKNFTIKELIDGNLVDISHLNLMTASGRVVGKVTYNQTTGQVSGTITEGDRVGRNEDLYLSFQAKVKEDAALGTVIREQGSASGEYTDGMKGQEQASNIVESIVKSGQLIFVSAPTYINFGEKLAISVKDERYPMDLKEGNLSVQDLRQVGSTWSMVASMTSNMKNGSNSLGESLYIIANGSENLIGENTSAVIYSTTTVNSERVDISDRWLRNNGRPFIKVRAGSVIRGNYKGVIQWTLRDTP